MYCDIYDEIFSMPYPRAVVLRDKERHDSPYYIFFKRYSYCSKMPIDFSNGPSLIKLYERESKYIFIDKNLKTITPYMYDWAEPFNAHGYAFIGLNIFGDIKTFFNMIDKNGNYIYVDSDNKPIWFSECFTLSLDTIIIEVPGKGWTIINSKGEHLCKNKRTDEVEYFKSVENEVDTPIKIVTNNYKLYYIDNQLVMYKDSKLQKPINPKTLDFTLIK